MTVCLCLTLLLLLLSVSVTIVSAQACGKTSKYVGATGILRTYQHAVSGSIEIVDDCTFRTTNFNYDGRGPDAYWIIANANDQVTLRSARQLMFLPRAPGSYVAITANIKLPTGVTFEAIAGTRNTVVISVWCVAFSANFADVVLTPVVSTATPVPPVPPTTTISTTKPTTTVAIPTTSTTISSSASTTTASPTSSPSPSPSSASTTTTLLTSTSEASVSTTSTTPTPTTTSTSTFQSTSVAQTPSPSPCPERFAGVNSCLANCKRFAPFLNVWWVVVGDTVVFELEADVADTQWVAFGISGSPNATSMIGADVAVAHFDSNAGGAAVFDYMLTKKSQCNYNGGADQGVCPDSGVTCAGKKGTSDVTFVSFARNGSIHRYRYQRKLDTGDGCDRAFSEEGNVVVWGTGPVTPASTLVVNVHSAVSDANVVQRLNVFEAYGVDFGCAIPPAREVVAPRTCAKKQLVEDQKAFSVTVENTVSYPNPPSWGVSFHFGAFGETPEIVVERGATYSFKLMTTAEHPFYIVDNPLGGRQNGSERVFAGAEESWGTSTAPKTLTWTVQSDAPDVLYYQCVTHIKLGWRIYVVDKGQKVKLPADTATRCGDLSAPTPAPTFSEITVVTKPVGQCGKSSAFVGASGKLSELQHSVSGNVRIIDDCTVVIDAWTFDGNAPDAYILIARDESRASLSNGVKILPLPRGTSKSTGGSIRARLPADQTWESLAGADGVVISAWCVAFSANFGSVLLKPRVTMCDDDACCNAILESAGARPCSQCASTKGCAFVNGTCTSQSTAAGIRNATLCADRCVGLSCEECIGNADELTPFGAKGGVDGCVWCDAGRANGIFNRGSCSLDACRLGDRVKQTVCYSTASKSMDTQIAISMVLFLLTTLFTA